MEGDFRDVNKAQLGRLDRLLRGESDDRGSGEVAGVNTQEQGVETMAKKSATGQFDGMEDDTPQELLDMAKLYKKEQLAEGKAKAKTKATRGALINKMMDLKVSRFRVEFEGNLKWLTLQEEETIKWEKSENGPSDGDE